jgi:hypothetical protein
MLDPLSAFAGACLALGIREWVEYLQRLADKRANCIHDFEDLPVNLRGLEDYTTLYCRKCGYQEPKREKE